MPGAKWSGSGSMAERYESSKLDRQGREYAWADVGDGGDPAVESVQGAVVRGAESS